MYQAYGHQGWPQNGVGYPPVCLPVTGVPGLLPVNGVPPGGVLPSNGVAWTGGVPFQGGWPMTGGAGGLPQVCGENLLGDSTLNLCLSQAMPSMAAAGFQTGANNTTVEVCPGTKPGEGQHSVLQIAAGAAGTAAQKETEALKQQVADLQHKLSMQQRQKVLAPPSFALPPPRPQKLGKNPPGPAGKGKETNKKAQQNAEPPPFASAPPPATYKNEVSKKRRFHPCRRRPPGVWWVPPSHANVILMT